MNLYDELIDKEKVYIYGDSREDNKKLAYDLLNNYLITVIDILNSKEDNIKLLDNVGTKNITMMFTKKKEKALLVEDIHMIYKYDKSFYQN